WISGLAQYVTLSRACDSIPVATTSPAASSGATITSTVASGVAATGQPTPTPPAPSPTVNQEALPTNQGCYRFQNQLGAELNVTVTRTDTTQSKILKVPSGQETTACLDPGHYTY